MYILSNIYNNKVFRCILTILVIVLLIINIINFIIIIENIKSTNEIIFNSNINSISKEELNKTIDELSYKVEKVENRLSRTYYLNQKDVKLIKIIIGAVVLLSTVVIFEIPKVVSK